MTDAHTEFEKLLASKRDQVGVSILLVLAWIAVSDGSLDSKEEHDLKDIAKAGMHTADIPLILRLALSSDLPAIQLACEVLHAHFHGERAELFMELAIGMSIADRYLVPAENYILRFLADLLDVGSQNLNQYFQKVTGKPLPEPPDISSHVYWQQKQQSSGGRQQSNQSGASSQSSSSASAGVGGSSLAALAALGLESGASKEEIKTAYRRLAKIHHPDRYHSLGEEAVAAANITFTRIQKAYEHLARYA